MQCQHWSSLSDKGTMPSFAEIPNTLKYIYNKQISLQFPFQVTLQLTNY